MVTSDGTQLPEPTRIEGIQSIAAESCNPSSGRVCDLAHVGVTAHHSSSATVRMESCSCMMMLRLITRLDAQYPPISRSPGTGMRSLQSHYGAKAGNRLFMWHDLACVHDSTRGSKSLFGRSGAVVLGPRWFAGWMRWHPPCTNEAEADASWCQGPNGGPRVCITLCDSVHEACVLDAHTAHRKFKLGHAIGRRCANSVICLHRVLQRHRPGQQANWQRLITER